MLDRVFAHVTGIDPRRALKIGAGIAVLVVFLIAYGCARESGREAEANETRQETAETVEQLEQTYEQIDETRAGSGDDAVVERLRDGSFLAGDTGGETPLPAD